MAVSIGELQTNCLPFYTFDMGCIKKIVPTTEEIKRNSLEGDFSWGTRKELSGIIFYCFGSTDSDDNWGFENDCLTFNPILMFTFR